MFDFNEASYKTAVALEVDESIAQYTGGELMVEKSLTPVTGLTSELVFAIFVHLTNCLQAVTTLCRNWPTWCWVWRACPFCMLTMCP